MVVVGSCSGGGLCMMVFVVGGRVLMVGGGGVGVVIVSGGGWWCPIWSLFGLHPAMDSFPTFGAPAPAPPEMVFFDLLPPPSRNDRKTSEVLIKKLR